MKKKIFTFIAVLIILFWTSAAAAWWSVNASVRTSRTRVQGSVYNGYNRPIVCRGYVYGRTYYGQVLNSWMNVSISPGRTASVYVYTNNHNPFVNGWGNVECRWY